MSRPRVTFGALPDDLYIYKVAERGDIAGLETAILSMLRGIR
jgi:hypothetical protein